MVATNDNATVNGSKAVEPIAVKWHDARKILGMSNGAFARARPHLLSLGLIHYKEWYDVKSLKSAWEKLCLQEMGLARRRAK